jgi:hypothetical protein
VDQSVPNSPVGIGRGIEHPPTVGFRLRCKEVEGGSADRPGLILVEHAAQQTVAARRPMTLQPLNGNESDGGVRTVECGAKGVAYDGIRRGFERLDGCDGLTGRAVTIDQLYQTFHGSPF